MSTSSVSTCNGYESQKIEAQKMADESGKNLAFGYDSYHGWTSVDASDLLRVAELGDAALITPATRI